MIKMMSLLSVLSMVFISFAEARNDKYDEDVIYRCRVIEILRKGQKESDRFIIRGYSKAGRVIETFRSVDGRPFSGRSEAELGLFLLVDDGSCPTR